MACETPWTLFGLLGEGRTSDGIRPHFRAIPMLPVGAHPQIESKTGGAFSQPRNFLGNFNEVA